MRPYVEAGVPLKRTRTSGEDNALFSWRWRAVISISHRSILQSVQSVFPVFSRICQLHAVILSACDLLEANMHPNITVILVVVSMIQGLAKWKKILISAVLPHHDLYKQCCTQNACGGHVIKLATKFGIVTSTSLMDWSVWNFEIQIFYISHCCIHSVCKFSNFMGARWITTFNWARSGLPQNVLHSSSMYTYTRIIAMHTSNSSLT